MLRGHAPVLDLILRNPLLRSPNLPPPLATMPPFHTLLLQERSIEIFISLHVRICFLSLANHLGLRLFKKLKRFLDECVNSYLKVK